MGKKDTGGDSSDDEKTSKKWNGTVDEMSDWEKQIARWCRKKWGTSVGNLIWEELMACQTWICLLKMNSTVI